MSSKPLKRKSKSSDSSKVEGPKKRTLFDHVKHIRQVQDPDYYTNLSDEDRKSFNHFMIIRALSMDEEILETMAQLYQIFDKIPSPQFYKLLIALVPKSNRFFPWVKSKRMKHSKELLGYVAKRFQVAKYQANEYVNLLLRTEAGQGELVNICKAFGLEDKEIEDLFDEKSDD
jgi:hypothetical protein